MTDDLEPFVKAQDACWETVLAELRAAKKVCHWIWFVFPQVEGLGTSDMSKYYAIRSLDEARAYLAHDVLGPRLHECCRALLDIDGASAEEVLGGIDAMKLRSSMTLFARADPSEPVFTDVLVRFFDGREDERTVDLV